MMTDFIQWASMHGYGWYVWLAYGIVWFGLSFNVFLTALQGARIRHLIQQWWHCQ